MAYVGGGFGKAGLHSVLEPAAWGLPVVFGPWWSNSREAGLLLDAGAAVSLPPRSYGAGRVLAETWSRWLEDDEARLLAGRKALEVVQAGAGASDRNARLVEQLVLTTASMGPAALRR
jgi:3-deoxy-D-manno-octulosonic-acid transferase